MDNFCQFKRITLTGAPGCGKSAVLKHLKQIHNPAYHVAFIDEVATKVLNSLPTMRSLSPAFFQGTVTTCQAQIEEAILSEWKQNNLDHGLLIADRGLYDYFCYTTPEQEKHLNAKFNFTPYDLVIYLHGIYEGQKENDVRTESPEEVDRLDKIGLDVWKKSVICKHDLIEIDYTPHLEDKVRCVAKAINAIFMKQYFNL